MPVKEISSAQMAKLSHKKKALYFAEVILDDLNERPESSVVERMQMYSTLENIAELKRYESAETRQIKEQVAFWGIGRHRPMTDDVLVGFLRSITESIIRDIKASNEVFTEGDPLSAREREEIKIEGVQRFITSLWEEHSSLMDWLIKQSLKDYDAKELLELLRYKNASKTEQSGQD